MMEKKAIVNGTKWAHKESGKVIVILDYRAKTSTVLYEPVDKSDKPKTMVTSTLSRCYKSLEEAENKPEKSEAEIPAKAEKKAVSKSSKKSPKPSEKKAEEKTAKEPKSKKVTGISEDVRLELKNQLVGFLTKLDLEAKTYEKYPFSISVRFPEKTIFSVELRNTHIRLRGISELLPKDAEFKAVKGGFDATLNYKYTDVEKLKSVVEYTVKNFGDSELVKRKSKKKTA